MWVMFVLVAWIAALSSCGRLCRAAFLAGRLPDPDQAVPSGGELSLYETAFLAGGPRRVTELVLVRMARAGRVLLAHTGWATVVDPEGRDALERGVLSAIGPDGQQRIPVVRAAAAGSEAITALGEDLTRAGLAVPAGVRKDIVEGVKQVRIAGAMVVGLWLLAQGVFPPGPGRPGIGGWFALPLIMVLGCLVIARIETYPYTQWASVTGQQALARLGVPRQRRRGTDEEPQDERTLLTALAVRGPGVLPEPELRAALRLR